MPDDRLSRPCYDRHPTADPDNCLTCRLSLTGTPYQKKVLGMIARQAVGVEPARVTPDSVKLRKIRLRHADGTFEDVLWDGKARKFPRKNRPVHSKRTIPRIVSGVLPCRLRGDELTGEERAARGLSHTKLWLYCGHPEKPLGDVVCPCRGCRPGCPGYEAAT